MVVWWAESELPRSPMFGACGGPIDWDSLFYLICSLKKLHGVSRISCFQCIAFRKVIG